MTKGYQQRSDECSLSKTGVDVSADMSQSTSPMSAAITVQDHQGMIQPVMLVVLSSVCFTLMNTFGRKASHEYNVSPPVVAMSRGIIQFFLSVLCMSRITIPATSTRNKLLLVLRAVLGALASLSRFATLSRLQVALSSALFTTTPIFAIVFGALLLKRPIRKHDILAVALSSSGASLIAYQSLLDIPQAKTSTSAVVSGLSSAALTAAAYVVVRIMGTKVHVLINVCATGVTGTLVPVSLMLIREGSVTKFLRFSQRQVKQVQDWRGYCALMMVGVFAFCAASCLNRALQFVSASRAATIRTMDIPCNMIAGYSFLGEFPSSALQVFGCTMIAVGAYVSAVNKGT